MLLTRLPLAPKCPFDLHVLSLPPAFALSQDQTLKLDENFEPAWSRITFDEVHHNALPQLAPRTNVVLYLLRERVPPKSLPTAPFVDCSTRGHGPQGPRRPRFSFFRFTCQTARDQGGPKSSGEPEQSKPMASDLRSGAWSPISVRSFEDAPSHRGNGVPTEGVFRPHPPKCQHLEGTKIRPPGADRSQPSS